MKKHCYLLLLSAVLSLPGCRSGAETYSNPLDVAFGDPFVLAASDGRYYMYGTTEGVEGFAVYSSDNLVDWTPRGNAYVKDADRSWGVDCFWAPEVYERDGRYYMFFSANWKENPQGDLEMFRIGVVAADSPVGPFVEMYDRPVFDPGYPVIDANVLWDGGRVYLYYSRCCYEHSVGSEVSAWARGKGLFEEIEESWVYGVEMKPDFSGVIGEPVILLAPPAAMDDPQTEWESRSVTAGEVNRRWTEGSFIIRKGGTYYMMYSANYYGGQYYAVGYATSDSPLGPFTKSPDNPVLAKNTDSGGCVTGTGHNMVLTMDNGEMYCVYHGRTALTGDKRVVFIDRMEISSDGRLTVRGPTTDPQPRPSVN